MAAQLLGHGLECPTFNACSTSHSWNLFMARLPTGEKGAGDLDEVSS